ncbi:response regulator [Bulleidia sp. HCP3S3_F2]|uniref:response regulator n=1 Tax=unclassified Bulleidia TaxID=2704656 RepID=UPI002A885BB7|nr:response regulator transcription factor [Bulleidia sp.]
MTMIYCVEDDKSIREIEMYTLQSTGFETKGFEDGHSFFEELKEKKPDLILLDVMLPDEDGISILTKLKKNPDTNDIPVIIASAKGEEYDKIKGLDTGADDYLAKPFGMMEMISRIKAVLRRSIHAVSSNLTSGNIEMDLNSHIVKVNGEQVDLTLKEYELLKLFISHPGIVYSREALLNKIWEVEYYGETRTVDVHIRTLRSKLMEEGNRITTVRGVGYRYEAMV